MDAGVNVCLTRLSWPESGHSSVALRCLLRAKIVATTDVILCNILHASGNDDIRLPREVLRLH